MRVAKTVLLGAGLTEFYRQHDRQYAESALDRLKNIERLLEEISFRGQGS